MYILTKSDLKPLLLSTPKNEINRGIELPSDPVACPLCDSSFSLNPINAAMLHHLLTVHKLVIADVKLVADLKRYLEYWKERFHQNDLVEFCSVIKTNSRENDAAPSESYFLLCDVLPEDRALREKLQKDRLDSVLEQQQLERNDPSFLRNCLFCEKGFTSREKLFNHMLEGHNFSVGRPDNIVFGNELLDLLEDKLKKLQCLFCEKTFKDWQILKEHMRKKQHRKINPKNTSYDRFYVVNYLEMGKNWETLQDEDEADEPWQEESPSASNLDWEDWTEEGVGAVCLFCDFNSSVSLVILNHMKDCHHFDLDTIRKKLCLNFYHQVKLINYIRRQIYHRCCIFCDAKFEKRENLLSHLTESGHSASIPESSVWDQPQYFFPTYEDDHLLCVLDDDEVEDSVKNVVIPEDTPKGDPETMQRILNENL